MHPVVVLVGKNRTVVEDIINVSIFSVSKRFVPREGNKLYCGS